ncbi:C4-dicarboxylate-specific signal transduction histidine kinase [Rhizomicrobium palustre]|uniref:histidine kinase n=1 Tax=Rhizomicrobium palustre TaxID=189966 RepID=A0A846MZ86_9PROT|nr:ATP-binding protein [Rhizomicrobium palustre]NIK88938.1 C4-dicarboxylate-specific signal transduction histidine kinase [Rhizomicrobium palustre]
MSAAPARNIASRQRYRRALRDYVRKPADESSLETGLELGRSILEEGHSLVDLLAIHYKAVSSDVLHSDEVSKKVERANEFLTQVAAPYEMAYLGWRDVAYKLRTANEDLEKRVAERTTAYREAEERLNQAQRIAGMGSWQLDLASGTERWSDQMYRMCGLSADRRPPAPDGVAHFVDGDDIAHYRDWLTLLKQGDDPRPVEFRLHSLDGAKRFVRAEGELSSMQRGDVGRIICTVYDITEQKVAEARYRELQNQLAKFSRQSVMGQMGTALSHELNQPLAAVMNYLNVAKRSLAAPVALETLSDLVDKALRQARRAADVIRNLRDFTARGTTDRLLEPLDEVLKEAYALALFDNKDETKIQFLLDSSVEEAMINRVQIEQVLVNLFRNAAEAMVDSGRREIIISTKRKEEYWIEIAVSDSGPGLPPEIADRLFSPFVTTKAEGMGIGLSICRSIVESHGGTIWVDVAPGGGACFHFTVPDRLPE